MFIRDMWIIQPPNYQWALLNPDSAWPSGRGAHSGVLFVSSRSEREFWIYGGRDASKVYDELWMYSFVKNVWILVDPGDTHEGYYGPGPRAFHSAVSYVFNSQTFMLIFGGTDGAMVHLNDLWMYDFQKKAWLEVLPKSDTKPSPRVGQQALVNNIGNRPYMWVFGGQGERGEINDAWLFDITASTWSLIQNVGQMISRRSYFSAAVFNSTSNIVYGGFVSENNLTTSLLNDMWVQTRLP